MIYKNQPTNWVDLQNKVADVFRMIGHETHSPYSIILTRGSKEVDVYAHNKNSIPEITIIVECKNWESNVPKDVVHSFKTVVEGSGANIGFIISKNGFQSGSFEAAEKTNIKLLTWHEFNNLYVQEYFQNIMLYNRKYFELLTDYTEPINSRVTKLVDKLSEKKRKLYYHLKDKYWGLGFVITKYSYELIGIKNDKEKYSQFPIRIPVDCSDENNILYVIANSVEEFFEAIKHYHDQAMLEFESIFGRTVPLGS